MLYGSKYDWGNFDQCIDLNYQYKHGNLVGKYCPYLLMLPDRETGFANTDVSTSYIIQWAEINKFSDTSKKFFYQSYSILNRQNIWKLNEDLFKRETI